MLGATRELPAAHSFRGGRSVGHVLDLDVLILSGAVEPTGADLWQHVEGVAQAEVRAGTDRVSGAHAPWTPPLRIDRQVRAGEYVAHVDAPSTVASRDLYAVDGPPEVLGCLGGAEVSQRTVEVCVQHGLVLLVQDLCARGHVLPVDRLRALVACAPTDRLQ